MTIRVALEHRTTYRFDRPIEIAPHVVRLRPAPHCRTPIVSYSLRITPGDHFLNWQQDPFGNYLARLVFPKRSDELSIVVDVVADLSVINPFDFFIEDDSEELPISYDDLTRRDLAPYLVIDDDGPLLRTFCEQVRRGARDGRRTVDFLVALNQAVFGEVAYTTRMEPGVQTPDETLEKQLGSCRDSSWLLVQVLRHLGFAARFVSGYLVQLAPDERPLDGPGGPEADFTDLHAWCEVYLPGAGWVGLDPTSGLFAGEGHIPLSATPHPRTAAPVTGLIEPAEVTMDFSNVVRRVHEDPRVTKPYTDSQWASIDAVGQRVDRRLADADVRLTVGGEPTFVSIDEMEAPEWTIAADGEHKRELAWQLTQRLAARFATQPLLHHGQGKWYPGEALPRWQMGIHWRTDGQPLWTYRHLLADPNVPGTATNAAAEALMQRLAVRLGVPSDVIHPAYEDPIAALWDEVRKPAGEPPEDDLDPTDPDRSDPERRAATASDIDLTITDPTGWVLPIHPDPTGERRWATTRWEFRRGRLILTPGSSPIGLRLPLNSIGWTAPPPEFEPSPFEPPEPLPEPGVAEPAPAAVTPATTAPTTAICVEVRDGHVRVFLPPVTSAERFVSLLGAVEQAVVDLGQPVVVEGYPPPNDPRLQALVVTPDPGVIEVNVHPVGTWAESVDVTTALYHEARHCRLGTEKFQIDGTHSGTGGGNHLTLGGARPADSPLLRRPDLLRSLITYWQHHPSLSYLFSGLFVGPTSQAPRVDEGRLETLDELEIAFDQLDRLTDESPDGTARPWVVDRLFRNLLADLTGNTHRSEFCIDKLFSPDSERGRLGLLELRAFEMPPHPQMALVQQLLVRSIIARCWDEPYRHPLVRWGTDLHDRFLLPAEVAADIRSVVEDLRAHGIAFDHRWFTPFLEFRFPRMGVVHIAGVELELRSAIEPWLVLGEEATSGGTARYVDSSLERLQVTARGLTDGRHVVTCNGIPLPLQPATDEGGAWVAGVRYKAWQPPSGLHTTVGVHTPLVFDLVDRWNGRSVGGCTYHVSHPGGLSYDRFPVNANEAEARRASRFVPAGHSPGPVDVDAADFDPDFPTRRSPRTLDLRRTRRR